MKAREVRQKVLDEHTELRGMLDQMRPLVDRFEDGDDGVGSELRERALALYARFESHLDFEDQFLTPALRAGGPDGNRHADHLAHEHREQRELLSYLLSRFEQRSQPTLLVAREFRNFSEYLRLDMQHEEVTLLTDAALRTGAGDDAD